MMFLLILILLLFSSCASHYASALSDYRSQRFDSAEAKLKSADLPYTSAKEAALFCLNRAMVRFCKQDLQGSLCDFHHAIDAIDYYSQFSAPEMAAQILLEDDIGAYRPPPFEAVLARFYYALALLQNGEEDNAAAVLSYLENHDLSSDLTAYLLALLLERRGDKSNAAILYKRAGADPFFSEAGGTLLVFCHRGSAPHKISVIAPASVVSAAAIELAFKEMGIKPASSSLVGIAVPELVDAKTPPLPKIGIDPRFEVFRLSYDVELAARSQLKQDFPSIALRSALRQIMRRSAVAAARKKHQGLVDFSMAVANIMTKADTRSWQTLPARIDLVRIDLPPGLHTVEIDGKKISLSMERKKLQTVHLFCLKPNQTKLLE